MVIVDAQYCNDDNGNQNTIKATVDGKVIFAPLNPANRHYAEIMRQVAAGDLAIEDAD